MLDNDGRWTAARWLFDDDRWLDGEVSNGPGNGNSRQQWMVDGNGWHDGNSTVIDLTAKDSNGRHEGNLPAIEGLTVMKGDGWRWMAT
jgi:hypothetical protein